MAVHLHELSAAIMTQDEKDYFRLPGSRIAQMRKDRGLTQVQLAKALGISQQMVRPMKLAGGVFQCRCCKPWPRRCRWISTRC